MYLRYNAIILLNKVRPRRRSDSSDGHGRSRTGTGTGNGNGTGKGNKPNLSCLYKQKPCRRSDRAWRSGNGTGSGIGIGIRKRNWNKSLTAPQNEHRPLRAIGTEKRLSHYSICTEKQASATPQIAQKNDYRSHLGDVYKITKCKHIYLCNIPSCKMIAYMLQ